MVKLQIDLNSEEDKIVTLYKVIKGYKTKEIAVKQIIKEFKSKVKI